MEPRILGAKYKIEPLNTRQLPRSVNSDKMYSHEFVKLESRGIKSLTEFFNLLKNNILTSKNLSRLSIDINYHSENNENSEFIERVDNLRKKFGFPPVEIKLNELCSRPNSLFIPN